MTIPYLRKALVCVAIGAVALLGIPGAQAQVGLGKDDRSFVDEIVPPRTHGEVNTIPSTPSFPRANYIWPFASGPEYISDTHVEQGTPGVVTTPVGVFRIGSGMANFPAELAKSTVISEPGGQYFFLQTAGDDSVARLSNLVSREGGYVVSYDPNSKVMVAKVTASTMSDLNAGSGVVAIEPFHSALKLHPAIGRAPLADMMQALVEVYTLDVLLFPRENPQSLASALTALGGNVTAIVPDTQLPRLVVDIHRSRLAQIAALEPVMLVMESTPWMLLAEETTATMQTGGFNGGATPYHDAGITGSGGGVGSAQILMVLDSGIQLDNGDLSHTRTDSGWNTALNPDNVIANHRKVVTYETTNQFGAGGAGDLAGCDLQLNGGRTHGHIVAAAAVGNGTNVAAAYLGAGWVATDQADEFWALDGVAPGGRIVMYDGQVTPGSGGCEDPIGGLGSRFQPGNLYVAGGTVNDGSLEKAFAAGARTFNISFGKIGNTYSAEAIQIDQFLANASYKSAALFIASGNNGKDEFPAGGDGKPDFNTMQAPATAKNALAIGASRFADRSNEPDSRGFFSGTGPAVNSTSVNRTAPQLMAPGDENNGGLLGMSSEFACRSNDNDQSNPVECDITAANEGTSRAAPAAAGAAMLVRDYFAQGFHPGGKGVAAQAVSNVSGALVRAMLVASADFMSCESGGVACDPVTTPGFGGANLDKKFRWNSEQGYGRIQLDNVLPLETWSASPSGLAVVDVVGAINNLPGGTITGTMGTGGSATQSATFKICNDKEPLSAALVWVDLATDANGLLQNNLDLTLISPSGVEYRGNYFTDDANKNGTISADTGAGQPFTCNSGGSWVCDEDCPAIGGIGFASPVVNEGRWSLPICENTLIQGSGASVTQVSLDPFDKVNPMEAIYISPNADGFLQDRDGDGEAESPTFLSGVCTAGSHATKVGRPCGHDRDCAVTINTPECNHITGVGDCCQGGDLQTEAGTWTVQVKRGTPFVSQSEYALVLSGGVCIGSSVQLNKASYRCNDKVQVVVAEDTAGLSGTNIDPRTVIQVIKSNGTIIDEETVHSLIPVDFTEDTDQRFVAADVLLSANTAPDKGNGVLDVNDGDTIQVLYTDVESGKVRTATADVNCTVDLTVNAVLNVQFGQDSAVVFFGGCERNLRGKFELAGVGGFGGFPDRYLDPDEFIQVDYLFQSDELAQLDSVNVSLSCVYVDADSPSTCQPDGTNCTGGQDPRRNNNPSCDGTVDVGTIQPLGTQLMTVVDPVKNIGILPDLETLGTRFSIKMANDAAFAAATSGAPSPTVELLIQVADPTSGKSSGGLGVNRLHLNVDAVSIAYSTDFPLGGTDIQVVDLNGNEVVENPVYEPGPGFQGLDYRFETRSYGNLQVGKQGSGAGTTVARNLNLRSPWNFDGHNGGFTAGLGATTDEATVVDNIYQWGEDENFNNIEDGVCRGEPSIRCFKIGGPGSDPRCTVGPTDCDSIEDRRVNGSGLSNFSSNWSTKGGCGWQTRATQRCGTITTRGCFTTADCNGTCINANNSIVSTFKTCTQTGQANCTGGVWQCASTAPADVTLKACGRCCTGGPACTGGSLAPCIDQEDSDCPVGQTCEKNDAVCGGVVNSCTTGLQTCDQGAGTCVAGVPRGGVWHTGVVNVPTAVNSTETACFGSEATKDCQTYGFISGTGGGLEWWSFLQTPVIQKVDQRVDANGDPQASVEITNWMWNHAIDLPDNNAQHTWELDTDTSKLLPLDLTSDVVVLNQGIGSFGAVSRGANAALESGWGLFAPMGSCGVKNCGGLLKCTITGTLVASQPCNVNNDCNVAGTPGGVTASTCTGGNQFGPKGKRCVGGAAAGQPCNINNDCQMKGTTSTCTIIDGNDFDRCEADDSCGEGGCNKGVCNKGKCASCSPAAACNGILCSDFSDCENAPGQTGSIATCSSPNPNTRSCINLSECESKLGLTGQGLACVGVGSECTNTAICQANFGGFDHDSFCTDPPPQGCKHLNGPGVSAGSASPCLIDEQCASGTCSAASGVPANLRCHFDSECNGFNPISRCGLSTNRSELCQNTTTSINGDSSPLTTSNRQGQNPCFFQGPNQISPIGREELGLAKPLDDDQDNDLLVRTCTGTSGVPPTNPTCTNDADCTFKGAAGPCRALGVGGEGATDEFVTAAGPKRNFDLTDQPWNGPDMRFFTLEDIYGDTGNTFQGALGFVNQQGEVGYLAKGGFGESIDDMVIEWREFTLQVDSTNCSAGNCATLILDTDRAFTGEGIVNFRVMDKNPWGYRCDAASVRAGQVCYPADPARAPCTGGICEAAKTGNDCDGDQPPDFNDAGDDRNCDNNAADDVIVVVKSEADTVGERVIANEISPGAGVFLGSVAVSALGDSAGVVFLAQIGADNPTIQALYADDDDGTGDICENSIVPEQQGFAIDGSVILLDSTCEVKVQGFDLLDNGDIDDYGDTNETVAINLRLLNNCGFPLTNCRMRVSSNDSDIDCIKNPIVNIPLLPCSGDAPCGLGLGVPFIAPPFQWRVRNTTNATDPNDPPVANFAVTLTCDEIDGLSEPQAFSIQLDLDILYNPADNTTWGENFDGSTGAALAAGGTKFRAQNNDSGLPGNNPPEGLINSDGYRCQYSDPDWPNAGSAGNEAGTNCFPALNLAHSQAIFWQIDGKGITENKVNTGKAKNGTRSMYYGIYDFLAGSGTFEFTSPASTLEGAATLDPINLGVVPPPILSLWQQVSVLDGRGLTIDNNFSADRAVAAVQLADEITGNPIGDWIKIVPFQNGYDTQAFSNYFNCMFDPIDDGNTEDDFWDPTDPNRRLGPSTSCFGSIPGQTTDFCWSCLGATTGQFSTEAVCNGDTPPLAGDFGSWPGSPSLSEGTWLESKIDLTSFKGRRVRLRFMVSSLKVNAENWEIQFADNPEPEEDGWWIDDIRISSSLVIPASFVIDNDLNTGLPACGATCSSLSANLTVISEQPVCSAPPPAQGTPCGSNGQCAALAAGSTCVRVVNPGAIVLDAPGQAIEINALGPTQPSVSDACHNGALQFRFTAGATVLREWTENPVLIDAPSGATTYSVQVRCSTFTTCTDTETVATTIACPKSAAGRFPVVEMTSASPPTFIWSPAVPCGTRAGQLDFPEKFEVWRGPLNVLRGLIGQCGAPTPPRGQPCRVNADCTTSNAAWTCTAGFTCSGAPTQPCNVSADCQTSNATSRCFIGAGAFSSQLGTGGTNEENGAGGLWRDNQSSLPYTSCAFTWADPDQRDLVAGEGPAYGTDTYYLFARDDNPPTNRTLTCNELPFQWASLDATAEPGYRFTCSAPAAPGTPCVFNAACAAINAASTCSVPVFGVCDGGATGKGSTLGNVCSGNSNCYTLLDTTGVCRFATILDNNPTLPAP